MKNCIISKNMKNLDIKFLNESRDLLILVEIKILNFNHYKIMFSLLFLFI